ncbi:PREDICTED: actin cytoskeleton-regulatory complex protein pan-1 [Papilio xuthus]|uniref:Actin cytoskeleton-regulatory complex protein pan-1 n=1 Tax=Papilio xuthus TaxID=66420 RepID=A0AAJ6ZB63_PAPXU|nr:PREDICTED: actin cytoskeleton-regulatory complex protein pan-1 [Papilio xuthus]XP_013168856.1 PREDICTED: actin cytoskeleton-regulatory complex protein pan-1 [Papilio xuthus]
MATVTASLETQSLVQESRHSFQEMHVTETRQVKKKTKSKRHKEEGSISVSKSSEKLHKKLKASNGESNPQCEKCARPVYAMERVKAERRAWHKECFRCVQCNKQLTVETYQSDHTTLYCKPHFKQLFEPKPVDDEDEIDAAPKKHQMIICESNPVELPPDVVRASDKPDLGLEELAQLDVKSRFEVFERAAQKTPEPPVLEPRAPREKSSALLSKIAKFKAKGMDIGISDEYLNGVEVEHSSSEQEDDDDEDSVLKKSYKQTSSREQPVSFCNMSEIVGRFESGQHAAADRHRERKQEIQNIRTRLFMGKQAKIKEMYEQSVLQSEQSQTSAEKICRELELDAEKARQIKQRFENGAFNDENQPPKNRDIDDKALFNEGIAKKSRSIFLELDANAKNLPVSPPAQDAPKRKEIPFVPKDVVRAADRVEDVKIETADISDRFRFFETYRPETERKEFRITPPRHTQRCKSPSPEVYQEPSVVRAGAGGAGDAALAADRHTASRMINVFRQMEEQQHRHEDHQGPKPLKRFTPPPPGEEGHQGDSSECSSEEEEDSEEERMREYLQARERDEALKQAQQLARTKSFRERFEKWSESEPTRSPSTVFIEREHNEEDGESQLETARSLREKFEKMKVQQSVVTKTTTPKVNRFV